VDCLHSDAFVRAVSTGAVALYRHLMWPAQHLPLRSAFGLCWNALGLSTQLFARRLRSYPREIGNAHCRGLSQAHGSRITFEVWAHQGTWFWHVVNPQGTGGTIGAAATEAEAIREARSSIEEMSARVGASPLTGDAAAIEGVQSESDGILLGLFLGGGRTVRRIYCELSVLDNETRTLIVGAGHAAAARAFAAVTARSKNLDKFDDAGRYTIDLCGAVQDGYLQRRRQEENRVRSADRKRFSIEV
jgi:hypothetical protein